MKLGRSLFAALGILVFAACAATALGQSYPARTVTLVVGFAPGGGVDTTARLLASKLTESLGRPVVVENRPGSGSNIAAERVAKAAPDGHTLLVTTPAVAINMAIYDKLPFDTLRDLAPVTMISGTPNILVVNPSLRAGNVHDLIALARAKPGTLNYSSAGVGTTPHLCGELFKLRTGIDIVHIPYNGNAPSLAALIAGNAELGFAALPAVISHIRAGRLRALASTGEKRSELLPDVPTLQEAGVNGVSVTTWYGVFAPAGTPPDIVDTLATAVIDAVQAPDFRQRLRDQGEEPIGSTPDAFGALVRNEIGKWIELARRAGIRAD
jgi:tripartite-type tricarboxylate transporter receptor subunit TctC